MSEMLKAYVVTLILLKALLSVEGRSEDGGGVKNSSGETSESRYDDTVNKASSWETMAKAGTLYGVENYKHRRIYLDNPEKEPTMCFNTVKPRGGIYEYFICPEPGMLDDMAHCCGEAGNQECCAEDTTGLQIGAIVGGIVGGLVLIGVAIWICRRCTRPPKSRVQFGPSVEYHVCSPDMTPSPTTEQGASTNSDGYVNLHSGGDTKQALTDIAAYDDKTKVPHVPKSQESTQAVPQYNRSKKTSKKTARDTSATTIRSTTRRYSFDSSGSCSS